MEKEKYEKYKRLKDRLEELSELDKKMGMLAFYINENTGIEAKIADTLDEQLEAMEKYRDILQERITMGWY
ncbi:crAss001_48 related protein [Peptoniphilus asaccharolyticus]